jgi:hypothetical protein
MLLLIALAVAGCAPGGTAQSPTAAVTPEAGTPLPAATVQVTAEVTATTGAEVTATTAPAPAGPTPTGPPPDPLSQLQIGTFYDPTDSLVKRDLLDLDGDSRADEVFFTVSGDRVAITAEVQSSVAVLTYDDVYRTWSLTWASQPISGTAHPLPAANRSAAGGYNGGNILGTGSAILASRTTMRDGTARLFLWRWDAAARRGEPLKMTGEGGAEQDAVFTADLDLNLVDLDDDGVYEVVANNVAGIRVWRWDSGTNRFVQEEAR